MLLPGAIVLNRMFLMFNSTPLNVNNGCFFSVILVHINLSKETSKQPLTNNATSFALGNVTLIISILFLTLFLRVHIFPFLSNNNAPFSIIESLTCMETFLYPDVLLTLIESLGLLITLFEIESNNGNPDISVTIFSPAGMDFSEKMLRMFTLKLTELKFRLKTSPVILEFEILKAKTFVRLFVMLT